MDSVPVGAESMFYKTHMLFFLRLRIYSDERKNAEILHSENVSHGRGEKRWDEHKEEDYRIVRRIKLNESAEGRYRIYPVNAEKARLYNRRGAYAFGQRVQRASENA